MASKKAHGQKVFLDANIVIQAGKPPGGPIIARVQDLARAELVSILTTDLTVTEVCKKHVENDLAVIKDVARPHFRKTVQDTLGIELPETTKSQLKDKLTEAYGTSTSSMFRDLDAKVLSVDGVAPSVVFNAYASGGGFFSGDGKKDQFPDAFIFECIKSEASEQSPVIIVSSDNDFIAPVENEPNISLIGSLPELFATLGLQVDAPEVDEFLQLHMDDLVTAVDGELEDWGLVGDVEDSEIDETNVTEVEVTDLTSFGSIEAGGSILVVGNMTVKADVSYSHPDWSTAIYDSEDKRAYAFDDVSGETEVTFDADFSMSIAVDEDGSPLMIEEFRFRNGNFQYVDLHQTDYY